jgi:para-nitrobenzyl esterase
MSDFDDYEDIFAEGGSFDIPAMLRASASYQLTATFSLHIDYEKILYSQVDSVANGIENIFQCPAVNPNATNLEACLGGDKGSQDFHVKLSSDLLFANNEAVSLIKKILYVIASIIVIVVGSALYLYNYLSADPKPDNIVNTSTARTISTGPIVGFSDQGVDAWLGMPYAQPPVGELRWRAPLAADKWSETFDALSFGSACPQSDKGSEDCLFINVWSPEDSKSLPVMFWIHGGGNSMGEAATSIYDGARLARENNVVLVSINYRLGPLGWFRHSALRTNETTEADNSGNYGTLDIILALQWVRKNVEQFGGDATNVTMFGESAGAFDTLSLMASPLATGLFHKAISQSGGLNLNTIAAAENYLDDAEPGHALSSQETVNKLLIRLGKASDRAEAKALQLTMQASEISQLLHDASPVELIGLYGDGMGGMLGNPDLFADGHVLPMGMSTQEIFSDPANYNPVPIILGTNRDEVKLFMAFGHPGVNRIGALPAGFNDLAGYNRDSRYGTQGWKVTAVDQLADAMLEAQGGEVYAYRFDVDDWRDLGFISFKDLFGAAHALELPFVFGNFPKPLRVIFPDANQEKFESVSASMRSYWANFAYSGNPGRGQSNDLEMWNEWDSSDKVVPRILIIDTDNIRMQADKLSMEILKQQFLAEDFSNNQKGGCDMYKRMFRGEEYSQSDYENMGCPAAEMTN